MSFVGIISTLVIQLHRITIKEQNWWIIVNVVAFDAKYGRFPSDVSEFVCFTCEGQDDCEQVEVTRNLSQLIRFSEIEICDFLSGRSDLVLFHPGERQRQEYVNRMLRKRISPSCLSSRHNGEIRGESSHPIENLAVSRPASPVIRHSSSPMAENSRMELRRSAVADAGLRADAARFAADKNQVMDELLARPDLPSDYGAEMVALYRDRTQDVYTRDFAVQHIGLYAEALNRRGTYDPSSRESGELRRTLWDASGETGTIVATAAFRALADLAAFDPKVDSRRLDSRLVSCGELKGRSLLM